MRRVSPFADPAWARASDNLAQLIAGDPGGKAQYQSALTNIQSKQQEDRFSREDRGYFSEAADALMLGDPQSAYTSSMRTGNAGVMNAMPGFVQGNAGARFAGGEIDENQMRAFMGGAGNAGGVDTALSTGRADQVSARNAQESYRQAAGVQGIRNRSTLEGAAVQDAGSALSDPDMVRQLSLALGADGLNPENVLANSMMTGGTGIEDGIRMADPLSTDQYTAQQAAAEGLTADGTERLGENLSIDQLVARLAAAEGLTADGTERLGENLSTDQYTAQQAAAEGLTADGTERLGENLSIDQVLAGKYQGGDVSLAELGRYRYGKGMDAAGGGGGGGGPGEVGPMDLEDLKRLQDMEAAFEEQAILQLTDMGAPTLENGSGKSVIDASLAPQLIPSIIKEARDQYEADWQSNQVPGPTADYVRRAIQTLEVQAQRGESPFFGRNTPDQLSYNGAGQTNAPGNGADQSVSIGGRQIPMSRIEETARNRNMSVEEVIAALRAKTGG
jgi:hypothetical protein